MSYSPVEKELFHIHTWRCKHASMELEEDYVLEALKQKANRIVFTDHVPMEMAEGKNRMDMAELPDYISEVNELKNRYRDQIEILCGFEVEYCPSLLGYYERLKNADGVDLLIVGQHFYEIEKGILSYQNKDKTYEYVGQCKAMVEAINTGLFDVIAHPDRSFRAKRTMGDAEKREADKLIDACVKLGSKSPCLEKNYTSFNRTFLVPENEQGNFYKPEFWEMVPDAIPLTQGLDAHSVNEMIEGWNYLQTDCRFML